MIKRCKVSDGFAAPLENRCKKPAKRQHQPPQERRYHGVKEQTEDYDAGGVAPVPAHGRLHELAPRAGHESSAEHQRKEVSDRVHVEGEREVDHGPPGILKPRGIEDERHEGGHRRQEAEDGPERDPPESKLLGIVAEEGAVRPGAGLAGVGGRGGTL